ncbi:MAG: hypothetical protein D6761_08315 [Candidatus Dadabacteria bacterium]|nr:MAG: hypothetical protein D6761_08315 [Candidatus Dadabacteria bacterium]
MRLTDLVLSDPVAVRKRRGTGVNRLLQLVFAAAFVCACPIHVSAQVDPADAILGGDPADTVLDQDPADSVLEDAGKSDEKPAKKRRRRGRSKQDEVPDYVEQWEEPPAGDKPTPESTAPLKPLAPLGSSATRPADEAAPASEPAPESAPPSQADKTPAAAGVTPPAVPGDNRKPVPVAATAPTPPPEPQQVPPAVTSVAAPPPPVTSAAETPPPPPVAATSAAPPPAVLDAPPPPPVAATGEAPAPDVADQVLAEAATAAATETTSGYEELRRTIDASVQVYALEDVGELKDGLLIRRGRKGARGAPSLQGYTGVFRAISADPLVKNSFRFGTHLGFYRVRSGWDDTEQSHIDALGFFAYSVRNDLELRVAASAVGHHTGLIRRAGTDALFQTLGDLSLGGKYVYQVLPYLGVVGMLDLRFLTQVGSFLVEPSATSMSLVAGATLNLEKTDWFKRRLPLRIHANLGYNLDNSGKLLNKVDVPNASTFGGFGLSAGDEIPFVVAAEYLIEPWAAYFEYSADPVVRQRIDATALARRPSYLRSPHRMTFGGRWNPIENLTLDLAMDLAAGMNKPLPLYNRPEPPGPPYTLHMGFSYEWNPIGIEVIDLRGGVAGLVVDAETGEPLGGATIEYLDRDDYNPQVADPQTGYFETYKLPPGEILLRVTVEGYEPAIVNPEIPQRQVVEQKIFLRKPDQALGAVGALVGQVIDESGAPVTAVLKFLNADVEPVYTSKEDGSFVKILPEGDYEVEVAAEGYESKTYQVPIIAKKKTRVTFQLVSGTMLGALSGRVVDEKGRPLQATIVFLDAQIDPLQTDATGNFVKVLPPGNWQIEVRARGYVTQQYEVPIQKGRKTVVDVTLKEEQSIGAFAGKVLDEEGRPVPAVIHFDNADVPPVPVDPSTGRFAVLLKAGTYDIRIQAPDYAPITGVSIPVLRGKKTVQEFRMESYVPTETMLARLEGNKIVTLQRVAFEPGTTMLKETAYPVLESVAKLLLAQPRNKRLRITVHTHNLGPADANLRLSQERADKIRDYLVSLGVPVGRIEAVGRGEEEPIADNSTPEGRRKNERVEFALK